MRAWGPDGLGTGAQGREREGAEGVDVDYALVESPFAVVRLRTAAAKRFKKVENATAIIWKTLRVAEQTFRRLDAPERLPEIAEGVPYVDGVRQQWGNAKAAA